MAYGELSLPPLPKPPEYDPTNGRFLPGHKPHNKGKRWSEYVSKESQQSMSKGWANLRKHRPTTRPDTSGRCRKAVIAVFDDGTWQEFPYSIPAAEYVGGNRENIDRCCRYNQARHINRKTGNINTDHRYKGIRFYFDDDPIWYSKIR